MSNLKIKEVRNYLPDIVLPRELHPFLPSVPGVTLFIARCKQGKSNLISNLNQRSDMYGGSIPIFETTYIFSPTIEADKSCQGYFNENLKDRFIINTDMNKNEAILKDLVNYQSQFDRKDPDNLPPLTNILIDDCSGFIKRNSFISHVSKRYRHFNLNIQFSDQTITGIGTSFRKMATAVFLGKCFNLKEKIAILEEYGDIYENRLESVWNEAVKDQFNFCYLKLDELEPQVFQVGPEGFRQIDYKKYPPSKKNMLMEVDNTQKIETIDNKKC